MCITSIKIYVLRDSIIKPQISLMGRKSRSVVNSTYHHLSLIFHLGVPDVFGTYTEGSLSVVARILNVSHFWVSSLAGTIVSYTLPLFTYISH